MKTIIVHFAMLALLSGCASAYKGGPEMEHLKNSMSKQQALKIFHAAVKPSKNSVGICGHTGFNVNRGEKPKLIGNGFEYKAYKRGDFLREEERYAQKYNIYKKDFYTKQFLFEELTKVRILVNNGKICSPSKGDYAIMIYNSFATLVIFDVIKQDLNPFLASVTVLAPQAKLVEGAGI